MKTIIAGGRSITDYSLVQDAIHEAGLDGGITEVVCGGAPGVDELGERYAKEHGIPVKMMPAKWKQHGKAAGPMRNQEMADYAEALCAVWDGISRGTADMIRRARKNGLRVHVKRVAIEGGAA